QRRVDFPCLPSLEAGSATEDPMLRAPMKSSLKAAAVATAAACLFSLAGMGTALAQDWPTRSVTLVVPYGPGASNDTFTRSVADVMSRTMGQPFVVENRAGAGGFTGTNSVVQAEPDGYTFVEMPNSI